MSKRNVGLMISVAWIVGLIMSFVLVGVSIAAQDKKASYSSQDMSFMKEAAMGGMVEVELGRLASTQASSQDVKNFGQRMVTDHTNANNELKAIAQQKGYTLPTSLGKKPQKPVDKLSKKSGTDFDRAYMENMVKDHKDDIKAFDKEAKKGKDPDLKAFAAKTLPTLQDHYQLSVQINKQLRGK